MGFVFIQFSRADLNVMPETLMEIPGKSVACWWISEMQVRYMMRTYIMKQNIFYSDCRHIINKRVYKCYMTSYGCRNVYDIIIKL